MAEPVIVLICHQAPFGFAMASALQRRFGSGFAGVLVIHRPTSRRHQLARALHQTFATSRLERRLRRIERRCTKEAEQVFLRETTPPLRWPDGVLVHVTATPNDAESIAWLSGIVPDLIAVTGAPILCADIFGQARLGALNMHSSLLPEYRGTQAEFWQVLEGRLDTCGVSVHFIEDDVDTGDIVLQRATLVDGSTTPQMLRTSNLIAALDIVPQAVASVLDGTADPKPQGPGEAAKRSRDKTLELRTRLLVKQGHDVVYR